MSDGELWLVRHGETEWSASGRHTSVTDLPLTEHGEEVARALRDRLSAVEFGSVLTSPSQRARRTAELAGYPDAEIDGDLVEWRYGGYEGLTTPEIHQRDPDWSVFTGPNPGGEDAAEVTERLDRVVEKVRAADARVLVFSHGHASRALACCWLGLPVVDGAHLILDTATVSVLGYEHDVPAVARWNA